jgi:hypothetical protein
VLVPEALENAPGGVALLGWSVAVLGDDRVDDAHERTEL